MFGPDEAGVITLAEDPPMQLQCSALAIEAVVDTSSNSRPGNSHYLARPTGFKRYREVGKNVKASLATCFRVQKNQTVDAECLRAWRADYLDHDEAFHPSL